MAQDSAVADEIIKMITSLSSEQKRELAIRLRNTSEGIKAYQAVFCGITKVETVSHGGGQVEPKV